MNEPSGRGGAAQWTLGGRPVTLFGLVSARRPDEQGHRRSSASLILSALQMEGLA